MTPPAVVDEVIAALAAHPGVVAITLGGSRATGRHDARSDLDIEVFTDGELPPAFRRELAARFDPSPEIGNDWFGAADEWVDRASGTAIDIAFFDRAWFETAIRDVIERHRPALGYTTALWHTLRHAGAAYDRDGWLSTMGALAATPYPDELRRAIVAWNHPVLRTSRSSYRHQIDLAVLRRDPVSINHRVAALLASAFDIVFALHRTLHPGEKRLLDHLAALGEHAIATHVRELLRAAGDPKGDGVLAAVDALCDTIDAAVRDAGLQGAIRNRAQGRRIPRLRLPSPHRFSQPEGASPMPSAARKVIISCAITGGIHVPSQTPHLPITSRQIADSAVGAAEAGAAVLHLHARNPETGEPTPDPDVWAKFLPSIHERTDAIINMTTGGGLTMSVEDRLRGPKRFQPEMCSLNMGSINFGLYPIKDRVTQFQHDWEEPYLEGTRGGIFRNTFLDIETFLRELGEAHGTRFEFECYDIGHVYNLAHFLDRGLIQPPLFVQSIFGILGGIGTDPEDLLHMRRTLDRLIGRDNYVWSILGAGRHQTNLVTMGAIMGGNTRVGLEDNIYLEKGKLAESNADQVSKIRRILKELSLDVATPDEAREMLQLKGRENTAIA